MNIWSGSFGFPARVRTLFLVEQKLTTNNQQPIFANSICFKFWLLTVGRINLKHLKCCDERGREKSHQDLRRCYQLGAKETARGYSTNCQSVCRERWCYCRWIVTSTLMHFWKQEMRWLSNRSVDFNMRSLWFACERLTISTQEDDDIGLIGLRSWSWQTEI